MSFMTYCRVHENNLNLKMTFYNKISPFLRNSNGLLTRLNKFQNNNNNVTKHLYITGFIYYINIYELK